MKIFSSFSAAPTPEGHEPAPTSLEARQRTLQRNKLAKLDKGARTVDGYLLGRTRPAELLQTLWTDTRLQVTRAVTVAARAGGGGAAGTAVWFGLGMIRALPVHALLGMAVGAYAGDLAGVVQRLIPSSAHAGDGASLSVEAMPPVPGGFARPGATARVQPKPAAAVASPPPPPLPVGSSRPAPAASPVALAAKDGTLVAYDGDRRLDEIARLRAVAEHCDGEYFRGVHEVQKLQAGAAVYRAQVRAIDEDVALQAVRAGGRLPGQNYLWSVVATGAVFLGASLGIFAAALWLLPSVLCIVLARHLFARQPAIERDVLARREEASQRVAQREDRIELERRKALQRRKLDAGVRELAQAWVA